MKINIKNADIVVSTSYAIEDIDVPAVCHWIEQSDELALISDITDNKLSAEELVHWLNTAERYVVASHDSEIIGLATLTDKEANLPEGMIEVCHCIVKPQYRRVYNGTSLVHTLTAYAKRMNYSGVLGRVVTSNTAGKLLLKSLNWTPQENNYSGNRYVSWIGKVFE